MLKKINNLYLSSWKNKVVLSLIVLLLVIIISSFFWNIFDAVRVVKLVHSDVQQKKTVNTPLIVKNKEPFKPTDIFGNQQQDPIRVNTSLNLEGVIIASDNKHSEAMISSQNAESVLYKVGDEVSSGLKLERVYQDHVVLNRSGILEKLYLNWDVSSPSDNLGITPESTYSPVTDVNNIENIQQIQDKIRTLPHFKGFDIKSVINKKKWGREE